MSKNLSVLLAVFLTVVFSFTSCNKKNKAQEGKKEVKKEETKKETKKEVKKETKKEVKEVKNNASSSNKLDLSYFPEKAILVGSFDVKAFFNIKELEDVLKDAVKEAKKNGIDLKKAAFISYYLNIEDLNKEPEEGAVLISGFKLTEDLIKKMGFEVKKENYNGIEIMIDEKKQSCIAVMDNDTVMGATKAVKKMIDVKKGKIKSLAKSDSAKEFKNMLDRTKGAAFRIILVNNKLGEEQLKKLAQGQGAMAAEFLNNFKSGAFTVSTGKDAFTFSLDFHSSKAGVEQVMAIAQPQLAMLTQPNSPALGMSQGVLGKDGSDILAKVLKTLKLKKDGEYLSVTLETKYEYWKKAPAIFQQAMTNMNMK